MSSSQGDMRRWEDMSQEEQDELYPVWLAVVWCLAVFGPLPLAGITLLLWAVL